jgi:hypothetical protein
MFILLEESALSFTIFDNTNLLYAQYLSMQHSKNGEDILMDTSLDEYEEMQGIDLEEITVEDDSSGFDDFTNIEDLDDGEGIDEFSDNVEIQDMDDRTETISDSGFNEDYQRFTLIQSALNTFYKDPKYKSQFIESAYIADGVGVSSDLKNYLEEEIFLNVFIRKIDLGSALCEMAKAEI